MSKNGGTIPKGGKKGYQQSATSSTVTYVLAGLAVVVIAALVIGGVIWNSQRNKGGVSDQVLSDNAAMIVGSNSAEHTIDVFEDFMCPACGMFEKQSGADVVAAVNDGTLRVRYHMLNFLDPNSASKDYSTRAAAAAQCVAEKEKPDVFLKFHTALFNQQPTEGGSSDHDNAQLAQIAAQQGAGEATQRCIADGAMVDKAKASAKESETQLAKATGGRIGTPTVLSAGAPLDVSSPDWLSKLLSGKS